MTVPLGCLAGLAAALMALAGDAVAGTPPGAMEKSRVLVLHGPSWPAPLGFVEALRIQLAHVAEVDERVLPLADDPARDIETARRILDETAAVLAVWVSATAYEGSRSLMVYAVGARADRALVEVARVPAAPGAEWERALALKVAALVDEILGGTGAAMAAGAALGLEAALSTPAADPPGAGTARPRAVWGLGLEIGAWAALDPPPLGPTAAAVIRAGLVMRPPGWLFATGVEARFPRTARIEDVRGRLRLEERVVGGYFVMLRELGSFGAGLELVAAARLLSASGVAPDGRTGAADRTVGVVGAGVEGRFAPHPAVGFHVVAGLEAALVHQRFAILGETLADLGRVRPILRLSVALSLP